MVRIETANKILPDLVAAILESKIIKKTDRISCVTNGQSNIAQTLADKGFKAKELTVKEVIKNPPDVLITCTSHQNLNDIVKHLPIKVKVLNMYHPIFHLPLTHKTIKQYQTVMVGQSTDVVEDGIDYPFDNKVFVYDFSASHDSSPDDEA